MPAKKKVVDSDDESSEEEERNEDESSDDEEEDDSSSEEVVKKASKKGAKKAAKKSAKKGAKKPAAKRGKKVVDSDSDESEEDDSSSEDPKAKKGKAGKKPAKKAAAKPKKKKEEEEEEDDSEKWWNQPLEQVFHGGNIKWKTLKHNGPIFAPPYVRHGVPIKYEGQTFTMTDAEEEVATMFAVMRESPYYQVETFRENFFASWRAVLHRRKEGRIITKLALCNFDRIWEWYLREKEKKNSRSAAEKKLEREKVAKETEPHRFVIWDGRKEKVANPAIEPPGLFRGRGLHPKQGNVKRRIHPEDVTINCEDVKNPPKAPEGHKWGSVVREPTVTWLAKWNDTNTGDVKYTMLDKSGALKQIADREKFEKARRLKDVIKDVRKDYEKGFLSKDKSIVQRSVAMYFIDKLALRVGGDKGEEEADTVGCCSLRREHIETFIKEEDGEKQHFIHFDFLGKDSIRYVNDMPISGQVFTMVNKLCEGKDSRAIQENQLFNLVTPSMLNDHFKSIMDGLSAKVFRTYNASHLLDTILADDPVNNDLTENEKMVYFNDANTKVAVLCNHQKAVSKAHAGQSAQLSQAVEGTEELLRELQDFKKLYDKTPKGKQDMVWKKKAAEFQAEQDLRFDTWVNKWGKPEEQAKWKAEKKAGKVKLPTGKRKKADVSESESEEPPAKARKTSKGAKKPTAKRGQKAVVDSDDDESDESDEESDEDEEPSPAKKAKKSAKKGAKKPAAKRGKKVVDSDDDESEEESSEEKNEEKKDAASEASDSKMILDKNGSEENKMDIDSQ